MAPRQWTAHHLFDWRSSLAFARRRAELLEWLERRCEPSAFIEDYERVGVEIGGLQRITVRRSSMSLDLLSPEADVEVLRVALDGVFECMSPERTQAHVYLGAWSKTVAGGDYEELRTRLAQRASGLADPADVVAMDCAVLVDAETPDSVGQIEFGFVSGDELRTRVEDPDIGRLSARFLHSRPPAKDIPASLVPDLAVFCDINLTLRRTEILSTPDDVLNVVGEATAEGRRMISALSVGL